MWSGETGDKGEGQVGPHCAHTRQFLFSPAAGVLSVK